MNIHKWIDESRRVNVSNLGRVSGVLVLAVGLLSTVCSAQNLVITNGQKVAFLGDSITGYGSDTPGGYVRLVVSALATNGVNVVCIPSGIGGSRSTQMLARLDSDVLSRKPDWMMLSCGVNDACAGTNQLPIYKREMPEIIDRAQAAGVKVMILTPTMVWEDPNSEVNKRLVEYLDFLHALAKEKKCMLADLNAEEHAGLKLVDGKPACKGLYFTSDGVHMNYRGNQMMAVGVLKAIGMNDQQLEKARTFWLDIPAAALIESKTRLTLRQYNQLAAMAERQNIPVQEILDAELAKTLETLLKSASVKE